MLFNKTTSIPSFLRDKTDWIPRFHGIKSMALFYRIQIKLCSYDI